MLTLMARWANCSVLSESKLPTTTEMITLPGHNSSGQAKTCVLSVNVVDVELFAKKFLLDDVSVIACHIRLSDCPARTLPEKSGSTGISICFLSEDVFQRAIVEVFLFDSATPNNRVLGKTWFVSPGDNHAMQKRFRLESADASVYSVGTIELEVSCVPAGEEVSPQMFAYSEYGSSFCDDA